MTAAEKQEYERLIRLIPGYNPYDQSEGCTFVPEKAEWIIGFIEKFVKHAKGKKAGKPFLLEDWEKAIVANLFGWIRDADQLRRYREALIYVAKKNGKSALIAAILIVILTIECRLGAEIFSAAASGDQAALIFSHASGMVKQNKELAKRLSIYGDKGGSIRKSIVNPELSASYKCLAADADTVDGVGPYFVAIDELHRHKDNKLSDVLQKGTGEQPEPLVIYTTTADYNRPSACNNLLKRAKAVRDNKGDKLKAGYDPAFLPVVYEANKNDDYTKPETWRKANPNMGVTVTEEFLARECRKAVEQPSELNNFLRLNLNIVTDAAETWIPMDRWDKCAGLRQGETAKQWRARMLVELLGEPCFLGMDLSAKIDITAIVQIFRPSGNRKKWIILPHFWVPADTAEVKEKRDRVPYAAWEREGFVKLTDGSEIDSPTLRTFVNKLNDDYSISEIGYDDWNATELSRQLREEDGFDDRLTIVRQGSKSLSDPMKEFEAMVMAGRIEHGANPCMNWMIGNLCIDRDDNGNLKPDKKKSTEKIDGPVALFTGMARALAGDADGGRSVYETRGVLSV